MTLKEFMNIKLPCDKVAHFFAGLSLALMFGKWPFWAFLAVVICAIGKEISDYYGEGTPDILDAFVTIIGGAIGVIWFAGVLR